MKKTKHLFKNLVRPSYQLFKHTSKYIHIRRDTLRLKKIPTNLNLPKIFYFGVTEHSNMGDLGQYYCIKNWIIDNYPYNNLYEFAATTVVDKRFGFLEKLSSILTNKDIIIFQSGYTTQDLGGVHDLMHRIVINKFPAARILMMPQTIFFQKKQNKERTAKSYNQAKNMLFLSRDAVSHEMATNMFPDIHTALFPDIVTTLIGRFKFSDERKGILICRRNDDEKYYSEAQILSLKRKIEKLERVSISDTTIEVSYKKIKKNLKLHIEEIIKEYSQYRLIITDRYHGTIFSLAANTPVIVIKTNDHKVKTGVDWFKGIYDNHVFFADSLDDVHLISEQLLSKEYKYELKSYFHENYYKNLKKLFERNFG